jgi:hypothetical protein
VTKIQIEKLITEPWYMRYQSVHLPVYKQKGNTGDEMQSYHSPRHKGILPDGVQRGGEGYGSIQSQLPHCNGINVQF